MRERMIYAGRQQNIMFFGSDGDKGVELLIVYLIIMNSEAFASMYADKKLAQEGDWRIPEKILFGEAVLGGSIGAIVGMYLCHHKTRKPLFYIGVPIVIILQGLTAIAITQL